MHQKPIVFFIRKPWLVITALALILVLTGGVHFIETLTAQTAEKVIVIDPGHGGMDGGAQYAGLQEKDINLDIALHLRQFLESKGYKVIMTRESDRDFFPQNYTGRPAKRYELSQRVNLAEANQASLFVSIHTNSYPQSSSYGMESYYYANSVPGKALAEEIQRQLHTVQPDNKRVAKPGSYYLINQTKMPAVIVEVGFISNARERKLLQTGEYRISVSQAIGAGIENFFHDYPLGVANDTPGWARQAGPVPISANAFKLYFPTAGLESLVSEDRTVSAGNWQLENTAQKVSFILQELFQGPKGKEAVIPISPATRVLGVKIQNGIAVINLSGNIRDNFPQGTAEEELAVRSIVWSAVQVPGVQGVRILIDGQFGASIGGHVQLNRTFTSQPPSGRVALVIDDFGINNPGTEEMLSLNIPLTAAVMPNLQFSTQEAERLHAKGYEIILHMPLEAKNARPEWLGPGALKTGLTLAEDHKRLLQGLSSVPFAVGISNHMGSKGSEDPTVVGAMVEVAKERGLFILDSRTSQSSILEQESQKAGLFTGKRDIFLDNSHDTASIKRQLLELIKTAKANGKAIGIGHVGPQGPNTARAIKEMLPEFAAQGIQIIPLSELLQS